MNNTPKRNDNKINYDQYKQTYDNAQKAINISFDPSKFTVFDDGKTKFVSINIPTQVTEFEVRLPNYTYPNNTGSPYVPDPNDDLFKVCSLRAWGVPETGSPTLSTSHIIPVSGDPYGYWETELKPTWDYVRFTDLEVLGT